MPSPKRRPKIIRFVNKAENLPQGPGEYYWDHWDSIVTVVKRGRTLYVTPPSKGAIETKISLAVVGKFVAVAALPKETAGS